jgi:glycosyltransferase involved in cell wall biosynthesis
MAAGAPVLASDLPVVRELVSSGTDGWLAVPDSPRALAAALDMLLENGDLRNRLAVGARDRAVRDFGAGLYEERLGAVYGGLLGGY